MPIWTGEDYQRIAKMKKDNDNYWRGYHDGEGTNKIGDITPVLVALAIIVIIAGVFLIIKVLSNSP